MNLTYNQISFDNEGCRQLLKSYLDSTTIELEFETNYGCGNIPSNIRPTDFNWEKAKNDLLIKRKPLWDELAKL